MPPISRRAFLASALAALAARPSAASPSPPHIVYILADDLGYGDVACLNPESKIPTPHIDRIARQGVRFTDCHSGSAVCTPTRYGILTGRYAWRTRLKSGVLYGYDPPLIAKERMTVADLLRDRGYRTACIGKWHLGLGYAADGPEQTEAAIDYSRPLTDCPVHHGFDASYIIPASLDMPPYVYIADDRVTAAPTGLIEKREGLGFYREGPVAPGFDHEDVLPHLTAKAVALIDEHGPETPLFLYFSLPAPHTPILPVKAWQGKSGVNPYADFTMQVDACVGRIVDALERRAMAGNTLLIVTSDNGVSPAADLDTLRKHGHASSHIYRGHKADIYEGGHRVPFIAQWPERVAPDRVCGHLVCLTDLMATAAAIAGVPLPPDAGEDSVSLLPALLDEGAPPARESAVHHSIDGSFAIRRGDWKLAFCAGSGGWSAPAEKEAKEKALPPVQLFHLAADPGETTNLQAERPDIVEALTARLQADIDNGRSTPGPAQRNDGATSIVGPKP